jgi:hypothetical protein
MTKPSDRAAEEKTGGQKEAEQIDAKFTDAFMKLLAPFMEDLEKEAQAEVDRYNKLLSADHEAIGRILRVHLIVEQYMNEHLKAKLRINNLADARLSFGQKANLLREEDPTAAFVKPGILQLNAVRNKFGHTLTPSIEWGGINAITAVLDIARKGVVYAEPIDAIEAFAAVACAFLIESPSIRRTQLEEALRTHKIKAGPAGFFW